MDLGIWFWVFCSVGVLLLGIWLWFNSDKYEEILNPEKPREPVSPMTTETDSSTLAATPVPTRSTYSPRPTDYEALSSLPTIYYGLAILCGVVLIGFTIANSDELSSTQIGAWVGYTVGGVLSMFAVGRVIELLQQIRDAVRNSPALSLSRPDDE